MKSVYRKFRCGQISSGERAQITGPAASPQEALLLSRLPLELREKIWREITGDFLLHLNLIPNSDHGSHLRCYVCRAFHKARTPTGEDTQPRCQGSQKEPCFFFGPPQSLSSVLSLLMTSRQIYLEAIDLLYATNTFSIDSLEPLQMFIKWTGQRVQSVQTVHVNIAMWKIRCRSINILSPEAFNEWVLFWQLLAKHFTGLLHVRLDVYGTSREALQRSDMQPLLKLSGLKSFYLAVWTDAHAQSSTGQDPALSEPLQAYVRDNVCLGR